MEATILKVGGSLPALNLVSHVSLHSLAPVSNLSAVLFSEGISQINVGEKMKYFIWNIIKDFLHPYSFKVHRSERSGLQD